MPNCILIFQGSGWFSLFEEFTISKRKSEPVPILSSSVASRKLRKWICPREQCSVLGNVRIGRWSRECYLSVGSYLGLFKFKSLIWAEHSGAINPFVAFMLGWSQRKCNIGIIYSCSCRHTYLQIGHCLNIFAWQWKYNLQLNNLTEIIIIFVTHLLQNIYGVEGVFRNRVI